MINFNPNAAATLTITGSTIRNGDRDAVCGRICLQSDASADISNSRIINNKSGQDGAGMYITSSGNVTITNSTIANNTADSGNANSGRGGGIYFGHASATLKITDSVIRDNFAPQGGGVYAHGTTTIENSELGGNSAHLGGGIFAGAQNTTTIKNSVIKNNKATVRPSDSGWGRGGGIFIFLATGTSSTTDISGSSISGNQAPYGGGLWHWGQTANVTNSTFSGNSSTTGGGGGIYGYEGTLTLTHVTIANNKSASYGGGLLVRNHADFSANVRNTLIAQNKAATDSDDCDALGVLATNTGNYIEDGTCSPALSKGEEGNGARLSGLVGKPAFLGLLAGSQAIDAANGGICNSLSPKVDQRGVARPVGEACDIGAYEGTYIPPKSDDSGDSSEEESEKSGPPPVNTGAILMQESGIHVNATYGLTSGANFQRADAVAVADAQVIAMGLLDAVDVWGYVEQGVEVCFPQVGGIVFLDAAYAPRILTPVETYSQPGFTCAHITRPGTVALVSSEPAPAPEGTASGQVNALQACKVTTPHLLRFRDAPDGAPLQYTDPWGRPENGWLPREVTLTALERTTDWIKVDYYGTQGWVSAGHVTKHGICG